MCMQCPKANLGGAVTTGYVYPTHNCCNCCCHCRCNHGHYNNPPYGLGGGLVGGYSPVVNGAGSTSASLGSTLNNNSANTTAHGSNTTV